jgi:hypothetical protein
MKKQCYVVLSKMTKSVEIQRARTLVMCIFFKGDMAVQL